MYAARTTSGGADAGVGMGVLMLTPSSFGAEARRVDRAECDVDGLLVGVEVDGAVAALVAEAGGLDAAERGAEVADVVRVEPHHPGLHVLGERVGALQVV